MNKRETEMMREEMPGAGGKISCGRDSSGRTNRVWRLLITLCAMVFVGSSAAFFHTLWQGNQEKKTFAQLAEIADGGNDTKNKEVIQADNGGEKTEEEKDASRLLKYQELSSMNPDFAGWLKIDGTMVDYPVMYTPEDIQYYIRRDFYGKDSVSGTPFIGDSCDADSPSVIIYGHNMKNGSMFGSLDRYAEKSYWEEHKELQFDTPEEVRRYEVFAAFRTRLLNDGEEGFRYYEYVGNLGKEAFDDFVREAAAASAYDTGIVPEYGDQLVILSTCSYHTANGRFVVAARRLPEEHK